ncbi:MAG: hypothetical protein IKW39_03610 [Alphaproteobacteria bacterium]|nr:hypothetical protein [Alphaproteobacteria bacterium]
MKKKLLKSIYHLFVIQLIMLVVCSCSRERSLSGISSPIGSDYYFIWSSTTKSDTLIYDCFQTVQINYEDEDVNLHPVANIRFYLDKKNITIKPNEDIKAVYIDETSSTSQFGSYPVTLALDKKFMFNDKQVVYAKAKSEYFLSADNVNPLPYMNIVDIVYKSSTSSPKDDKYTKIDLYFDIEYKNEDTSKVGTIEAKLSYLKFIEENSKEDVEEDLLVNTSYQKGVELKEGNQFIFYVEKKETWKLSGEKKIKYTSPLLSNYLKAENNKTLSVENFDFTPKVITSLTPNTTNKDDWTITENVITKTISYTNQKDKFEDIFVYPDYEASFKLDDKVFSFDLETSFGYEKKLIDQTETTKINQSIATLLVSSVELKEKVETILELKTSTVPKEPNLNEIPKHGKILAHYVSAVYSPDKEVTKKCVIIRYEEGYDWGICGYDEFFPSDFTYTQSGYSAFNSLAYNKQDNSYCLARASDEKEAIYWRKEDNTIIAAIDYFTCKIIGWKNSPNGKYSYKMTPYSEEYSDTNYTLTITAPNGSKKTFKSQKAE